MPRLWHRHLGDVWPWANALIAFGLRRFGFEREFERLARGLFDATQLFALDRLPEAIGGHRRDPDHPHPGIYPDSNSPQAWSASAVTFLIETMLGIVRLAPLNAVLVDPALPSWLSEITLSNLRFGRAHIALRFRRDRSGWTEHEVLDAPDGVLVLRPDRAATQGEDRLERRIRALVEAGMNRAASS